MEVSLSACPPALQSSAYLSQTDIDDGASAALRQQRGYPRVMRGGLGGCEMSVVVVVGTEDANPFSSAFWRRGSFKVLHDQFRRA
ncbi:hypothetical protein AU191_06675 [Mycolicibacterium acapulense]|nr:hypothetical protein AU191_06675 [Mycolicibacterium acapulense]